MAESENQGTPLIDPEKARIITGAAAAPATPETKPAKPTAAQLKPGEFCWGTGRRKSAIARVRLRYGSGKIVVNEREFAVYFPTVDEQNAVKSPLNAAGLIEKFDVFIDVKGGGKHGQADAAKLGIARALLTAEPDSFGTLRDKGFLTRDGRMKERKKYGQRGARRRFQFSKR